jgi:hypothetical protein
VIQVLHCLLCTAAGEASGKLSDFITTNRAVRHNFSTHSLHYNMYSKWWHNKDLTCRISLPPPPPPLFGSPPRAQIYLSQVSSHILSLDITIFFINDTFYAIQLWHSPAGHDGGSS